MLDALFSKKPKDKRRHNRREKIYAADWMASPGSQPIPVFGIDLSASGAGILSQEKIEVDEVILRIKLEDRVIPVRAKIMRRLPGTLKGRAAFRYGLEFTAISADDWDAVVRWTNNQSVGLSNKAQEELDMVRMTADDANRLMPKALEAKLHQMLVKRGRLAPDVPPLVQYFYGGPIRLESGMSAHRLAVTSRVINPYDGTRQDFQTRFYLRDNGEIEILS